MSFGNWTENALMNHIFGKATFASPSIFVGLCTAFPGEGATGGSCSEVSNANGYVRIGIAANTWNWSSDGIVTNHDAIIFPRATGGWGTVTYFVLLNSGLYGTGQVLLYGALSQPRGISQWSRPRFNAGVLSVSLD